LNTHIDNNLIVLDDLVFGLEGPEGSVDVVVTAAGAGASPPAHLHDHPVKDVARITDSAIPTGGTELAELCLDHVVEGDG
jgi:hypothetical protein